MSHALIEVDPNFCPEQLLCTEEEVLFLTLHDLILTDFECYIF